MTTPITRDQLRAALDEGTVTVVGALPASPYGQRHIPGALNLVEDAGARSSDLLRQARDHRHVLHRSCMRPRRGSGRAAPGVRLHRRPHVPGGIGGTGLAPVPQWRRRLSEAGRRIHSTRNRSESRFACMLAAMSITIGRRRIGREDTAAWSPL